MQVVSNHIISSIASFIDEGDELLGKAYSQAESSSKETHKSVLKYIDNILRICLHANGTGMNIIHIHLDGDFDDENKLLFAEFLILKTFFYYLGNEIEAGNSANSQLKEIVSQLKMKVDRDLYFRDGITRKQKNEIWEQYRHQKGLLSFYEGIDSSAKLSPRSLINLHVKLNTRLISLFRNKPFAIELAEIASLLSYNVLNTEKGLNDLDKIDSGEGFIDNLETIVLFDCERKKVMTNFSLDEILKWNENFGTHFKNFIVFSFGKDDRSFQSIMDKITIVKDRFKIPKEKSYTILSSELDFLLNREEQKHIPIEFVGPDNSNFWNEFLLETSIWELYELRSVKMLNLYSLVFNSEIKDYILADLFSSQGTSKFISSDTKQALQELREEDFKALKSSLSNSLDLILSLNHSSTIRNIIKEDSIILVPEAVIKDSFLKSKIVAILRLKRTNTFKSWSDLTVLNHNSIVFLAYRDQGKYPYYFYPNIIEMKFSKSLYVNSVFIKFFFGLQYEWSQYRLAKEAWTHLNHSIRENYFEWNKLKHIVNSSIPKAGESIKWDLENEYTANENRETYRLTFKGNNKSKIYLSSDLFIVKTSGQSEFKVEKISELKKVDLADDHLFIQNLDEIQEDINIYEKIVNPKQQDEELKVIRSQFGITETSPGKLWKLLLKNIADAKGEFIFYNELEAFLKNKNLRMVSFFHFKNSWINPQSESLTPLSNRVFMSICEFLNIPRIYYIIMQGIKNASKQASRQSTRQMNNLLRDLFSDGCFDNLLRTKEILSHKLIHYRRNHPLDELGIDENALLDNLVILVELIQPEIKLQEVAKIEKIEQ